MPFSIIYIYYKTYSENNVFRIEVQNGLLKDEAVVYFHPDAQNADDEFDSEKMFSEDTDYPQIYTLTDDNAVTTINGESELSSGETRIIPLGFVTYNAGTFTLNATTLDDFNPGIDVYLEDQYLGNFQDLRQTGSYTFSLEEADNADRFRLHFGKSISGVANDVASLISAYSYENTVYVNTPEANYIIELYDLLGNIIESKQSVKGLNKLPVNVSKGIYIVKVQNGSNVVLEKIMIK